MLVKKNIPHKGCLIAQDILMGARDVLADNVKLLKAYYGLSTLKFAKMCGVANGSIGRIVLKQAAADLDTISAIAEACHLQPWQLLTPGLNPSSPPVVAHLTDSERALYAKLGNVPKAEKAPSK